VTTDEYAQQQREAVRPVKCTGVPACWVKHGGSAYLRPIQGTPRCLACGDKLRILRWRPPQSLHIPIDRRSTKASDV
jgi:hypothetical protein